MEKVLLTPSALAEMALINLVFVKSYVFSNHSKSDKLRLKINNHTEYSKITDFIFLEFPDLFSDLNVKKFNQV